MSKKGGTTIDSPDPLGVASADFIFNRVNQLTPSSNLMYYAPGQSPPAGSIQQQQFNRDFLTPTAANLFGYGPGQQMPAPTSPGRAYAQGATGKAGSGAGLPTTGAGVASPTATGAAPPTRYQTGYVPPALRGDWRNQPTQPPTQGPTGPVTVPGGGTLPPAQNVNIPGISGNYGANFGGLLPATAVQTLAPDLLKLENARMSQTANTLAEGLRRQNEVAGGSLPRLISSLAGSGVAGLDQSPDRFRQETINSMYELGAEPLRRDFGRQMETVEQRLANQGLALGGEAASRVLSDFGRTQNESFRDLALQSVLAGGNEARASRAALGQEGVQNAQLAQSSRLAGLNELNTLLGLPQVGAPPIQSFFPSGSTGVTDAFGLGLAGQTANTNARNQLKGAQLGALSNLGVAGLGVIP